MQTFFFVMLFDAIIIIPLIHFV